MSHELSYELLTTLEDVLASHEVFGDSNYIRNQFVTSQRRRLSVISSGLPITNSLVDQLDVLDPLERYRALTSTVVRCAIQHSHAQIESHIQYGLPLADCNQIFELLSQHLMKGGSGSPLDENLHRLPQIGAETYQGWIWREISPPDIFTTSLDFLIRRSYSDSLCTPSDDDLSDLASGFSLLHELIPSLTESALSHGHSIGCFPNVRRWKNSMSSSQFRTGGTIFLNQHHLKDPWWVAEHMFHESLHQKLYDFRHGHSVLESKYLDPAFPNKELVKICSPWNPEKGGRSNYWDTHRALAAFHVYVHLALLALIADQRRHELEPKYGSRDGMIKSSIAIDRSRYLGEQLRTACWHELGDAGKQMVNWLSDILGFLDTNPAPSGAYLHLVLDLYNKETRKARLLISTPSSRVPATRTKLHVLAKREIEETRKVLRSLAGQEQSCKEFDAAINTFEEDPFKSYPDVRNLVSKTLLRAAPDGYKLPLGIDPDVDLNDRVRQMVRQSSDALFLALENIPPSVVAAKHRANHLGFTKSCVDPVGRLLSTLAAIVPAGGKILEIGGGTGVGTAWLSAGLGQREDVEVTSVERDADLSEASKSYAWPKYVKGLTVDAADLLTEKGVYDLIFADAVPFKYDNMNDIISLVRPGGMIVIDDMTTNAISGPTALKIESLRTLLLSSSALQCVELEWSSGVVLAVVSREVE